ncbi:unnamed protein product, partial [Adineta steineri]
MAGSNPVFIISDDFNNDNLLDLAVANQLEDTVSVFLGNGNGTFERQRKYGTGSGPSCILSGYLNNDSN